MNLIKRIAKGFLAVLASIIFIIWTFTFGASYHDGPVAILPGSAFTSGEFVSGHPDWSFVRNMQEVEFQTMNPVSSRTSYVMVHNNRIFIPSGYMTTWWGKIWKQWPKQVLEDDRAILRIDGKIYNRTMARITDDPVLEGVMKELARKYGGAFEATPETMMHSVDSGYMWIFELKPRSS